jgi:heptaprenyl diphosphate synthase
MSARCEGSLRGRITDNAPCSAYCPVVLSLGSLLDLPGLRDDLQRVETGLSDAVSSGDELLTEMAGHLLAAGGKRLRPALALAAGYLACAPPAPAAVVQGGMSVELVHLGSLYHDDVMDEAETRRAVETVNHRWGNLKAILAGDFLLARASEIAAALGPEVSSLLAATIGRLCEGQVGELRTAYDIDRTQEGYFASIAGKTGSLMSTACRIGALAAELPRDQVDALSVYGHALGLTFQIVDDILDVVATDAELGKPAGNDLVEGVYTLPVLLALADPDIGPQLKESLGRRVERAELPALRTLIRSGPAVGEARAHARTCADRAADALAVFGDHPVAISLARLGPALVDSLPR